MKLCLSFDDVLLIPKKSDIKSRNEPDISTYIGGLEFSSPLVSSPMDTVTDGSFAKEVSERGGLGIIHRFMEKHLQLEELSLLKRNNTSCFAVGIGEKELDRFKYIYDMSDGNVDMVNIDIANGHSESCRKMLLSIKRYAPNIKVIAGSVATGSGFSFLSDSGADAVRVGIGGGSICKTRIMTGFGIPTLSSIIDCYSAKQNNAYYSHISIIADGGIRYPSDMVKSLVAGADAVMCGKVFASTKESCAKELEKNGQLYKVYRGMASKEVQEEKRGGLKAGTCAEGVQTLLKVEGSLDDVFNDFNGGLRSAMTYANALNISQLRQNSEFVQITNSGLEESHAFGTRK